MFSNSHEGTLLALRSDIRLTYLSETDIAKAFKDLSIIMIIPTYKIIITPTDNRPIPIITPTPSTSIIVKTQ